MRGLRLSHLALPPARREPASDGDPLVQMKVWLLGVSPMVWRRVLVPADCTLRELHGPGTPHIVMLSQLSPSENGAPSTLLH
jgi:hypothetical protein